MVAGNTALKYDLTYKIFYLLGGKFYKKDDMSPKEEDVMKNFEIYEL